KVAPSMTALAANTTARDLSVWCFIAILPLLPFHSRFSASLGHDPEKLQTFRTRSCDETSDWSEMPIRLNPISLQASRCARHATGQHVRKRSRCERKPGAARRERGNRAI